MDLLPNLIFYGLPMDADGMMHLVVDLLVEVVDMA
jgi:hypothetical protein